MTSKRRLDSDDDTADIFETAVIVISILFIMAILTISIVIYLKNKRAGQHIEKSKVAELVRRKYEATQGSLRITDGYDKRGRTGGQLRNIKN